MAVCTCLYITFALPQSSKISIPTEVAHSLNYLLPRFCNEIQRTSAYSSQEQQRANHTHEEHLPHSRQKVELQFCFISPIYFNSHIDTRDALGTIDTDRYKRSLELFQFHVILEYSFKYSISCSSYNSQLVLSSFLETLRARVKN